MPTLRVVTVDGQSASLPFDDFAAVTVDELTVALEVQFGVPQRRQRLIFAGRQLPVGPHPLSAFNISDGATVHLAIRAEDAPEPQEAPSPPSPQNSGTICAPCGPFHLVLPVCFKFSAVILRFRPSISALTSAV